MPRSKTQTASIPVLRVVGWGLEDLLQESEAREPFEKALVGLFYQERSSYSNNEQGQKAGPGKHNPRSVSEHATVVSEAYSFLVFTTLYYFLAYGQIHISVLENQNLQRLGLRFQPQSVHPDWRSTKSCNLSEQPLTRFLAARQFPVATLCKSSLPLGKHGLLIDVPWLTTLNDEHFSAKMDKRSSSFPLSIVAMANLSFSKVKKT